MYKKSLQFATLLFFLFALSSANLSSQNCNSTLKVEKNRNFKSANLDGATFSMELTNESTTIQRYSISTKFLEESCANSTLRTSSSNAELATSLLEANSKNNLGKEIVVKPGQTYRFKVFVEAPSAKDYHKWSCIKVLATSQNCRQEASTILSVYLSDPSEQ